MFFLKIVKMSINFSDGAAAVQPGGRSNRQAQHETASKTLSERLSKASSQVVHNALVIFLPD